MKEIIVDSKYDGKYLNTFLLNTFDGLNKNLLYKTLRKKDIRVNDVKVSENVIVHSGDNIKVYLSDEQLEKNNISNIKIVYEDDNILVVNKPAGIEVVGENSLTNYLQDIYYNKLEQDNSLSSNETKKCNNSNNNIKSNCNNIFIQPCHRLDRNTTGLVLFAKNEEALNILLEKFKNHEIEKHYRATVVGIPKVKKADLVAFLFKDAKKSMVYISDTPKKGYEQIRTSYELISSNSKNNTSILDVTLHTGKTHQIRAHLAHIGYPIIGDGKYGINEVNRKLGYKVQQLTSFSLTFTFKSDSGILNYLKGKTITV